jgi:acyl carrier protein
MSHQEILRHITEIVQDELDDDSIRLTGDTKANEVPGWDSLAHVRIVIGVESAFKLRFDTNEITSLKKVGDLVALVERYRG